MKQRKRVTKRARASRKVTKIEASAGSGRRPQYLPEEWAGMYKPVKKPVTCGWTPTCWRGFNGLGGATRRGSTGLCGRR